MAEQRRGCGWRKVGGLYLCSEPTGHACCKLPILLHVCPTCGGGVKQTRGWTWIDPRPWIKGACVQHAPCPLNPAFEDVLGERVGLLWIGEQFYPTPSHFLAESAKMGVSRRIKAIPRGFHIGEHWIFFAHPKVRQTVLAPTDDGEEAEGWQSGVFQIIRPTRIEKIVTETMFKNEAEISKLLDAGIIPVVVRDDDKRHQGSAYDKDESNGELDL